METRHAPWQWRIPKCDVECLNERTTETTHQEFALVVIKVCHELPQTFETRHAIRDSIRRHDRLMMFNNMTSTHAFTALSAAQALSAVVCHDQRGASLRISRRRTRIHDLRGAHVLPLDASSGSEAMRSSRFEVGSAVALRLSRAAHAFTEPDCAHGVVNAERWWS
jgi:hypothetical protein